jgi:hypothetical protein
MLDWYSLMRWAWIMSHTPGAAAYIKNMEIRLKVFENKRSFNLGRALSVSLRDSLVVALLVIS